MLGELVLVLRAVYTVSCFLCKVLPVVIDVLTGGLPLSKP